MNSLGLTRAQDNEQWMALCRDPRWNYQEQASGEGCPLYYCKGWEWKEGSMYEMDQEHKVICEEVAENGNIHRSALAPKFVFEKKSQNEPVDDDLDVYMRRLICILCK